LLHHPVLLEPEPTMDLVAQVLHKVIAAARQQTTDGAAQAR
jgi:hypothetical protein